MSKKLIVAKFGGSSLANADALRQSAKIAQNNGVSLIIVSATGGTTDRLVKLADILIKKPSIDSIRLVEELKDRHQKIAEDLALSAGSKAGLEKILGRLKELVLSIVGKDYSAVLKEIYPSTRYIYMERLKDMQSVLDADQKNNPALKRQSKQVYDHILAYGEQLSSILLAGVLSQSDRDVEVIDARQIIKTDDHHKFATPDLIKIKKQAKKIIAPKLGKDKILLSQGFIGRAPDGATTTLGRGGSDYSAALFAEAIDADELQIWSDVDGVVTADPRIVDNPRPISHLTFQEAAELATSGAKILYTKTITPMRRANIPVYVGNTFKPDEPGTWIEKNTGKKSLVTAIALKKDQRLVTLTTEQMAQQFGFLAKVFEIFARHKVSIDQISTSEISVAFTLDNAAGTHGSLFAELSGLGDVSIDEGLSAVSLIGNGINDRAGLVSQIFSCLEAEGEKVAVRMISHGASDHNICFLVDDKYGEASVVKLHKRFIEEA